MLKVYSLSFSFFYFLYMFKKSLKITRSFALSNKRLFNQTKMLSYAKWNNFKEEEDSLLFDSDALNKIETHLKVDQLQSTYELCKDYSIVLIGEGSHGTKEYYQLRCDISKKLIENKKCSGICIEGDFPSVGLLHLYVTQLSQNISLDEALLSFKRFPIWMWCNETMREFIVWLHNHNQNLPANERVGIFGLDVYSLDTSMTAVTEYLEIKDPNLAQVIKKHYSCFDEDKFGGDPQKYGYLAAKSFDRVSCQRAVNEALNEIVNKTKIFANPQNNTHEKDLQFMNYMNATVVVDAEHYYRSMFDINESSWEVRDQHFFETIVKVREHLSKTRQNDHVVVWAHNSHLGDASYTSTSSFKKKEFNVGELVKKNYPLDSISIGQLCFDGTVAAADEWGEKHKIMKLNPALRGSWEDFFHNIAVKSKTFSYMIDLRINDVKNAIDSKNTPRLQRAVGVLYKPLTERQSHYFSADICNQFDIIEWFDTTEAVNGLEIKPIIKKTKFEVTNIPPHDVVKIPPHDIAKFPPHDISTIQPKIDLFDNKKL